MYAEDCILLAVGMWCKGLTDSTRLRRTKRTRCKGLTDSTRLRRTKRTRSDQKQEKRNASLWNIIGSNEKQNTGTGSGTGITVTQQEQQTEECMKQELIKIDRYSLVSCLHSKIVGD